MARLLAQFFLLVLSAFFLWAGGLVFFTLSQSQATESIRIIKEPVDAIVVLTGGQQRLETGFTLLTRGLAKEMFISGVHKDVSLDDLVARGNKKTNALRDRITMGQESHNTTGNVLETVAWMKEKEYNTLILVTSDYHMPRARLYFQLHAPSLTLYAWPVKTSGTTSLDWWKEPGNVFLMVREYSKYIISYLPSKLLMVLSQ